MDTVASEKGVKAAVREVVRGRAEQACLIISFGDRHLFTRILACTYTTKVVTTD